MKGASRVYVVDRIEGRMVVLVADDGDADVEMPRKQLAVAVQEGTVLRVPLKDGALEWNNARSDPAERARRLEEMRRRMARLREKDPGGDIEL